jgi:hypothetical protein
MPRVLSETLTVGPRSRARQSRRPLQPGWKYLLLHDSPSSRALAPSVPRSRSGPCLLHAVGHRRTRAISKLLHRRIPGNVVLALGGAEPARASRSCRLSRVSAAPMIRWHALCRTFITMQGLASPNSGECGSCSHGPAESAQANDHLPVGPQKKHRRAPCKVRSSRCASKKGRSP